MGRTGNYDDDADARAAKRRKVRKGTRSCWECRRRKIRCTYNGGDGSLCDGCRARNTSCVSQQFDEAGSPESADSPLAQRLSRVEDLLERLADQVLAGGSVGGGGGRKRGVVVSGGGGGGRDDGGAGSGRSTATSAASSPSTAGPREPSVEAQELTCTSLLHGLTQSADDAVASVPQIHSAGDGSGPSKYRDISKRLASVYPPAAELESVMKAHGGSPAIYRFFVPYDGREDQSLESLFKPSNILGPSSHPVLLARQLAQLAQLYQQAMVNRHDALPKDHALAAHAAEMVGAVTQLVTSNDDLVGSLEGLETICLIALYHTNFGNLRKGWLGFRRAITIAQLMGLDRPRDTPIYCIDSNMDPSDIPTAQDTWFQLNFSDRYNSLLLGMPSANDDSWFSGSMSGDSSSPTAHLERVQCVVSGKITKRNHNRTIMTAEEIRAIEADLDEAARGMGVDWWRQHDRAPPSTDPFEQMNVVRQGMMQVNHHHLLILLHLPYMIKNVKEGQHEHSKAVCLRSCRELLSLFKLFRVEYEGAAICRHTDYTALTASLTLLLGYLDPRMRSNDWSISKTRDADRQLIRDIRAVFFRMAEHRGDKLALEAYKVIGRLVPLAEIDQAGTAESDMEPVTLDIPYLGTINIKPVLRPSGNQQPSSRGNKNRLVPVTPAPAAPLQLCTPPQTELVHQQIPQASSCAGSVVDEASAASSSTWNFLTPSEAPSDDPMLQFIADGGYDALPDFSAEMEQWTFQGVDAAFFENFMGGLQQPPGHQGPIPGYATLAG
ncbi:uncharacterized protein B0I36DRAFT_433785 [Microdochium trichocladiopsis]|uniref:Zn(2)-C6 fungal-type domain-containing protein n=1 Tax=Microdochium trichocladiopsis TaxID=1682393 RepID=A0A9P8Y034_9PEZI|nr:uncharacterized protein B0I36DRAFT_433785 [Microdochium trichocladiopsis]KAH7026312.1 hypothetical protein B0I36DRAFT_433785 [Microdochium trichocladiopsis]